MALSGSFNTSSYHGKRWVTFSWNGVQSIENNTTTISWKLVGAGSSGYYISGNFKVVIAGETVYQTSADNRIELRNNTVVASGKKVISHNNDGTKSFSASVDAAIFTYDRNCSGSGSWNLDTIARASQPSCITYPITTQNIGDIGSTIAIFMNRVSSTFTHTVRYAFGSLSGTIATGVTSDTSWTIPNDFMGQLPNASSGNGTIYVDTYKDTLFIGTKSVGFTTNVPDNIVPTIDRIQWRETAGTLKPYGWPITQGVSKGTISIVGAAGAYGSTIKSYSITFAGLSGSSSSLSVANIAYSGTLPAVAKIIDSRGRSTEKTVNLYVAAYEKPKLLDPIIYRSDSTGAEDAYGEYIFFKVNPSITSGELANSGNIVYVKCKRYSDSTYEEHQFSDTDIRSGVTIAASSDYTWDWIISYADKVYTVELNGSVSTGAVVFDILANGQGFSFGKVSENEGLDCNPTWGDIVVSQGIKDEWIYRKWSSGLMECWTELRIDTPLTGYETDTYISVTKNLPFTFTSRLPAIVTNHNNAWRMRPPYENSYGDGTDNTRVRVGAYLTDPAEEGSYHSWVVNIIGRWK